MDKDNEGELQQKVIDYVSLASDTMDRVLNDYNDLNNGPEDQEWWNIWCIGFKKGHVEELQSFIVNGCSDDYTSDALYKYLMEYMKCDRVVNSIRNNKWNIKMTNKMKNEYGYNVSNNIILEIMKEYGLATVDEVMSVLMVLHNKNNNYNEINELFKTMIDRKC